MMEKFLTETQQKQIVVLDIPDEYGFMDEELIEEIKTKVDSYLPNKD